ncbi:MAG: hypothetical protein QM657_16280 [Lacrimispora sp.]|uniref:hypothetical protein n=1 Tax=Lacrimispora sp. TaxID=2719234 RepID=UPI0039E6AA86
MKEILNTFDYCGMRYGILEIGDGWKLVITQQGGHVFGPFSDRYPEGIFWIPESIHSPDSYKKLVDSQVWNTGGDRVWVAPEIQFNIMDRKHFRETLKTPKTIDPGEFSMEHSGNTVVLKQSIDLESHNTVTGMMHVEFGRTILKALNPLKKLQDCTALMQEVSYCGYEQVLDLSVESEQEIYAESWNLLQIRPKGTIYIPMYQPLKGTDHYEQVGEHEYLTEHGVCLKITGDSRYKIAYKSAVLTGRFGYLSEERDGESCLIIINYPNNPSAMYSEEPPMLEGDTGYSIHVYNDDGNSGGFAEMECNMQTIGRPTGLNHSIERVAKWIFTGKSDKLKLIAEVLLGYGFEE